LSNELGDRHESATSLELASIRATLSAGRIMGYQTDSDTSLNTVMTDAYSRIALLSFASLSSAKL